MIPQRIDIIVTERISKITTKANGFSVSTVTFAAFSSALNSPEKNSCPTIPGPRKKYKRDTNNTNHPITQNSHFGSEVEFLFILLPPPISPQRSKPKSSKA